MSDLLWNVLAIGDRGEAGWANHPPVDRNDYRSGENTKYDQPDSFRGLFRELYDTILLGARWPKSLLTMKAITKSANAPLWHRSASHLRKQMEWISLHNISNRRAGGLIWTRESTFFVVAAFSTIKPSTKPLGSLLIVDHQTKLTTLQSVESRGEALWMSDKKLTTRQGLISFFPRVITWPQLARTCQPSRTTRDLNEFLSCTSDIATWH